MSDVVITGASGMLGRDLCEVFADLSPRCLSKSDLDITDEGAVKDALREARVVINAAAYTKVDDAETHRDLAFSINADGPRNLAVACRAEGATLIHISTDYVFSGDATTPYKEDSPRHPVSIYGASKAAGEEAVLQEYADGSVIIRTAWLYGASGPSFPRTMLTLAATKDTVSVVDDQVGQPTWTRDLALQIRQLVDRNISSGIFHGTNSGHTTWWGFAKAIFEEAGLDPARVLPTSSAEFVRPAARPAWSVLALDAWAGAGIAPMRPWREAFAEAFPQCFSDIQVSSR
jgi:dTDP-4-dehydrorhamnose reductase